MTVQKITLSHAAGVSWSVSGLPASFMQAEEVTAYDARDVDPLVKAAQRLLEFMRDEWVPSVQEPLRDALQPFEVEEATAKFEVQRDQALRERDELAEALRCCGSHMPGCILHRDPEADCTCRFGPALALADRLLDQGPVGEGGNRG